MQTQHYSRKRVSKYTKKTLKNSELEDMQMKKLPTCIDFFFTLSISISIKKLIYIICIKNDFKTLKLCVKITQELVNNN